MEQFKTFIQFLTTKPVWAKIVILLAASAIAFALSSCSSMARVQRDGVHIDTVRVDYIIKTKNFSTQSF